MGTTYSEIYDRFLPKITDYKMLDMNDSDVTEMMDGWLDAAIARQKIINHSLDKDDDLEEFDVELTDLEKEMLALNMVLEWLRPQINSTALTSQFFGGKEEKFYAQSNHLNALKSLFTETRLEVKRLARDYGYRNNRYLAGD